MRISPFFQALRSAYQAELDDMSFDSEGKNVLRQRLGQRRKELGFLLKMIELSPEMVAVIFHQGFQFKLPAVMDHLLSQEPEDFPEWDSFADALLMQPWAHELVQVIRKEPMGDWFLTVAAGLEYMYGKPGAPAVRDQDQDEDQDDDNESERDDDGAIDFDEDEESDARAREEAGADWMVEQGFDRKD
jgi:hypothetical protein